ncbi:uncharacterized protein LOC128883927 [Hylaeus volcanicus]|uniref:uncharacterized protein LOC128883927 n=1 Tax=Hylaeus volcanicus TaxID=313075 RepID=UPI0023B7E0D6|nr:uncharacterized protein LOC128883927 [Hylaeus volcanicus]
MSMQEPTQKAIHLIESSNDMKVQSTFPPPLFDIPIHQTDETLSSPEYRRSILTLDDENGKKTETFNETQTCLSKGEDFAIHKERVQPNLIKCIMSDKKQKEVDSYTLSPDKMYQIQEGENHNLTGNLSKAFIKDCDPETNNILKSLVQSSQTLNTSINVLIGVINELGGKFDSLQSRINLMESSKQTCGRYSGIVRPDISNINCLHREEGDFEKITNPLKNKINTTEMKSYFNTSPTSESVNTIYKKPTTNPFSSSDQLYRVSAEEESGRQRLEELRRIEVERQYLLEQQKKRVLLDKKAKELMETISLTHDKSPSSLFDENVERCDLTKDCKRHTTGFNPLFE